ncbi:unnamed protein product [Rotaria sp. Silwood2]|nr:unnamed protein product [Rotaria sp. Silwood2]CAF4115981.1 unnamed protein product [Rotaria sp. Silwood2]
MWDRGLSVSNVAFINFPSNQTRAIFGPTILDRCTDRCGGWLIKFSNISFDNVLVRGKFRWEYDAVYHDQDGTLSGQPESVIMAPDGLTNVSTSCAIAPYFENAIQCPLSQGSWLRFSFRELLERSQGRLFIFDAANTSSTIVPWLREQLTFPNGYLTVLRANQTYTLQFEVLSSVRYLHYNGVIYDVSPGDYAIIQHPLSVVPYRANTTANRTMILGSMMPLSGSTSNNGDWYYDNAASLFSYIVKNPPTANTSIDIELSFQVYICPCNGCACPPPPTTTTTTATTATTTTATTATTTSATTTTTTSATTTTTTSATTTTTTSATTTTTTSATTTTATTTTTTTATTATTSTTTSTIYLSPIQPCMELPTNPQVGRNHIMSVDTIVINGGRLIAGLPTAPFNGNIDIIMTNSGSPTIQMPQNFPDMTPKMIGVLGGLDLHGTPRGITWTFLGITATAGQNVITLRQPVNWIVGDEIIITTTDTSIYHTERHRIARIQNGTVIYTIIPLAYTHIVIQRSFANGQVVNVAAAVGLLTHNVRVINQNPGSVLSGFKILVTEYHTNVWHIHTNTFYDTCYKGYARLSNTQFIGFAQFDDSYLSDSKSGIYMNRLGDYNAWRPTFIDACSFDSGFNAVVGMQSTNGIPITNNVIYNTYRSALVLTGTNNLVQNNLVAKVYWTGTGQIPSVAEFNMNNDGAIMTRDVVSVRLLDNMVAGTERLAYRIQGETCGGPDVFVPLNITNVYSNNEAHSVMSGVNILPSDKGFMYDRILCIRLATTHIPLASYVNISNSIVIGSMTPQDCEDRIDPNSPNIRLSPMALPRVSENSSSIGTGGRSGIVFPTMSRNNFMPIRSWTGVGVYPALSGLMKITNTTLAFFNDTCDRHDVAIQVSQTNDDGQFPITTSSMFVYNTSQRNLIFNGKPNLGVVNPSRCGDMDCDGLKKSLLIDTDGSLFGQPASVFSQSEVFWGSQEHGTGDFRIPREALTNLTGHRININLTYPYRGISRTNSCSLESSWGMYRCNSSVDYRMLIIESMDADTEKRRLSPVAIMSDSGYIDLINGPADRSVCNGYACRKRISTFMALVQSGQTYQIFFSSTPPKQTRFRLLNADSSIKCVLALHYLSVQQLDVYANTNYMPPTNRDLRASGLMLLDRPNNVSLSSPPGSNYFDRAYQMAYFTIDGNTAIDLRVSPLLILSFGFPPMDPAAFFSTNLVNNLAALLNINPDKIRRVKIVSAANTTRIRRQASSSFSSVRLEVEMRDEPRASTTAATGIRGEILSNIASAIINRYQMGELQIAWFNLNLTNSMSPSSLRSQEPFDDFESELSVISRLVLVTPPSDCRQQSPCTIQPVLIAYDAQGNVIQKLGSNDRPWQVQASLVSRPTLRLMGDIANYTNGQTQFTLLALPDNGTEQVQFALLIPDGVNSSFYMTKNLTIQTTTVNVSQATLAGRQVSNIYVVDVNQTFSVSVTPIDSVTRLKLAAIQWSGWQWYANVSLYTLPQFNRQGVLTRNNLSRTIVNVAAGTVTVTNLTINDTGMYVLKIQLVSSNNDHNVMVPSNGILVKQANSSVVALLDVALIATDISNAVSMLLQYPEVLSDLTITSVNINSRTYEVENPEASTSTNNKQSDNNNNNNNNALIIPLAVSFGTVALLSIGAIVAYQVHAKMIANQRIGSDVDQLTRLDQSTPTPSAQTNVENFDKIEFGPITNNSSGPNQVTVTHFINPQVPNTQTRLSSPMEFLVFR